MATVKNINMTPDTIPPYMKLSQYDVGRVINFAMKDGSSNYTVPSGATVTLEGTKPSGLGFTIECTVVGSTAAAATTADMTDEHGTVVAELVVRQGDTRIGSSNVRFDIEKSPHPEGTTDGSAEVIIPTMTQLVMRVEAAVAKEEVLHEAEAWAVGQRAGEDVDEDDDTYHNNAKYYAEAAETAKTSAGASERNAAGSASAAAGSASAAAASNTAAQAAKNGAEAAVDAAAAVYTVAGSCTVSVLPNGQVRETWTTEE